jgi:hypothetical protein
MQDWTLAIPVGFIAVVNNEERRGDKRTQGDFAHRQTDAARQAVKARRNRIRAALNPSLTVADDLLAMAPGTSAYIGTIF